MLNYGHNGIQTTPLNKTYILTLRCVDKPGIVAAIGRVIADQGGNIIESGQYADRQQQQFFMRVCFVIDAQITLLRFEQIFEKIAQDFSMDWQCVDQNEKPRVLIMVSQQGHCLYDLLYRFRTNQLPMQLIGVVSNHCLLQSLVEREGLSFYYLPIEANNLKQKSQQEATLIKLLDEQHVDLIILARYMQILSDSLVRQQAGKIINIHHSFLPSFKGARPYQQAYERGVKIIGATAHYVTAELDEGPIIEQDIKRVDHNLDAQQMTAVGRDIEAQVLAYAVRLHLERRILINGQRTVIFH